jgi:hypothetical protein
VDNEEEEGEDEAGPPAYEELFPWQNWKVSCSPPTMNLCTGGKRAPLILNLESKWRQVVCLFTAGEEYPVPNRYGYRCGSIPYLDILEQRKLFSLSEFETRNGLIYIFQHSKKWQMIYFAVHAV